MRPIRKLIMASLVLIFVSKISVGQDYKTGIGARLGGLTSGLTVKHFVNPTSAIEGIASFGYRSFLITGLYEKHNDIQNAEGLKWLYGGGAHIGFFRYGGYYYLVRNNGHSVYYTDAPGGSNAVVGLDFIIGMDYKFNKAPLNIGLDLKPFVDFSSNGLYGYFDGALNFRFVF